MSRSKGVTEAAVEGVKADAPGLTLAGILKGAGKEIGGELQQMAAHGAHELAAALFNGSGFVMYPRGTRDDQNQDHGLAAETQKPQQEVQQERGGHSL